MTELDAIVDATRLSAPPTGVGAPQLRLVPPVSEPLSQPQESRPVSRPRPVVEEDDFDSMWEEGVASW